MARGVTPAGATPALNSPAWLMEARYLAKVRGLVGHAPPINVRDLGGRALSIKVRGWGAGLAGPVDKSEELRNRAGRACR